MADTDSDRLDAGPSSSPSSTSSSPTQQRQGQEIGSDCEAMYGVHPDADANHEPRYEVHQDARKYKIGEPFPEFEIGASVMYTHNWYMSAEIQGKAVAVCRLCEEESMRYKTAGKQPPKSKKKKSMILKITDGSTRCKFYMFQFDVVFNPIFY